VSNEDAGLRPLGSCEADNGNLPPPPPTLWPWLWLWLWLPLVIDCVSPRWSSSRPPPPLEATPTVPVSTDAINEARGDRSKLDIGPDEDAANVDEDAPPPPTSGCCLIAWYVNLFTSSCE
jgi:hypothetical protein